MALALVVAAGAMLTLPLGVRRMIDYGFTGADGGLINSYFLVMIAIGLVLAAASATRFYLVTSLGERVVADLRNDIFANLTRLHPGFYEQTRSGEVMSRLTADTTQIKTAVGSSMSQALRNLVMFVGALTMMFVTSLSLSLLVLIAIPLIVLPLVAYGRVVRRLSRKAQDTLASASAYAAENIQAIRTLQAFTNEVPVGQRFAAAVADSRRRCHRTHPGPRRPHRHRRVPRVRQRHRRPLVRRPRRARWQHLSRPPQPVRALRDLCRGLARRAFGGLWRGCAGGRRHRAIDGTAGGSAGDRLAAQSATAAAQSGRRARLP